MGCGTSKGEPARRRLLLVANPFPPLASGGNARLLRFARYLPESGWDVTVLTVRASGPVPVPTGVRIERAPSPSPEAMYRLAQQAARTVHGARERARVAPGTLSTASRAPARRRSSRRGAINDWIFVPDEWVGWIGPAVLHGRRLLRRERYDAVMSSFPRPSAELVASILARVSGLPFLADYRDPWATRHLRHYPTPLHRLAHYALEEWALRPARAVTATAEPIAETLRRRFPRLAEDVTVLPNGYDPPPSYACSRPPTLGDGFWLVHTGRLYGRSRQLERMLRAFATLPDDVHWLFVGIDGGEVRRVAAALGVGHRVRTIPFVPHDEALALQQAADGLVLITGDAPEALSSKVFEYLAARRPIFAYIPHKSAAHALLAATGGAVVAPQHEPPAQALATFIDRARRGALPPPDRTVVEQYDGRRLTRRLADVLDDLVQRHRCRATSARPPEGGL